MEESNQEPEEAKAEAAEDDSKPEADSKAENTAEIKAEKPEAESKAETETAAKPGKVEAPAEIPAAAAQNASPLVGILIGTVGIATVCALTFIVYYDKVPYYLGGLDTVLDAKVRYQTSNTTPVRDWRKDFLEEQALWTNEISKIKLGSTGAKPVAFKRDYLLFLGDSYYRDEPHYMEARAAYMAAMEEPRLPHDRPYDLSDAELNLRIGYCALRLTLFQESKEYLEKALQLLEADKNPKDKIARDGAISRTLDAMTECAIRSGRFADAEALLKRRLTMIRITEPKQAIEPPILFNYALLYAAQGNQKEAEEFFKLAIECSETEDRDRGVIKGSPNDNSRRHAYILREYAKLLRQQKRTDESYAAMQRALFLVNNAP